MKLNTLGTIYTKEDIENAFKSGRENEINFNDYFKECFCSEKAISDEEIEEEINYTCDSGYVPELKNIFSDENIKNKIIDTFKHFLITFEMRRKSLNFTDNKK